MNFQHGLSLAEFQDFIFDKYKKEKSITEDELKNLKCNIWIFFARFLAPSNLVIRHYCLLDFITNDSKHQGPIIKLIHTLGNGLWLEGYSYWLYTKIFLIDYADKFKIGYISKFIEDLDKKFATVSYRCKDGKLYPPLYGDLKFISLEDHLQNKKIREYISIWPVSKETKDSLVIYKIRSTPMGFNVHIPKNNMAYYIIDGIVKSKFKWYEGYDKKYKTKLGKWIDILSLRRILSFFL